MRYKDALVSREHFFAIGTDTKTGKYYLTIPTSSSYVDSPEYYEIDRDSFEKYLADPDAALPFVEKCRKMKVDHLLLEPVGPNRGGTEGRY
jgi:hypothetical protein